MSIGVGHLSVILLSIAILQDYSDACLAPDLLNSCMCECIYFEVIEVGTCYHDF